MMMERYISTARGEGHKIDAIKNHDRVSVCVIDADTIVPEKSPAFSEVP
ncbi:MAG: hypothetical protein V8Q42_10790 [Anaerovoracaceae bacterium]